MHSQWELTLEQETVTNQGKKHTVQEFQWDSGGKFLSPLGNTPRKQNQNEGPTSWSAEVPAQDWMESNFAS